MAKVTLDKNGLAEASGTLKVFNFNSLTGEYTGSTDEYLLQGVGLPASACSEAPPQTRMGSVAVYRDGGWMIETDHRGETVYSIADGSASIVSALGDYPAGFTTLAPATAFDVWNGEAWETDKQAQTKSAISAAEAEKSGRIAEAGSVTQSWQTQLMLGIITDADKASLTAWMKYMQAVQAVDVSAAPDISWPVKPE